MSKSGRDMRQGVVKADKYMAWISHANFCVKAAVLYFVVQQEMVVLSKICNDLAFSYIQS